MLQWPWRRFTSGSSDFVTVVNRLKTRRDRDVLQHKKTQENVERVSEMIRSNRRVTIKEIFEDLNISYGSVVRRKRPKKWANGFILHHDNAPCHILLLVRHFLSNKNITVCPYPPYSPDLAPCDFWLFPKVKMTMKGKRFESIQGIEAAVTAQLKTLTKEDFQNCFRKWQERWDKCVWSEGEYFEGN